MQRYWSENKLEYFWTLLPEEKALLGNKKGVQRFLYLLLLKYYSIDYFFPITATDIPREIKDKPWIKLSPLSKQPEPQTLEKIKEIINRHWDSISLFDVLKEVDLRENFTESFTSSGNREILAREDIQKRLILCLFAIGTNTGLTRISSGSVNNVTLEELKYIKRKFINQDDLRVAITKVVNAIFHIRDAELWGETTTAVASDSRKFTSWDQNLMSQWHSRYKGPGVMIYWHVSKQSICIYSQLKTCSSSA